MDENQKTQQNPEKKGILEQLKGMGFWGYLGLCVIANTVVRVVEAVFGNIRRR